MKSIVLMLILGAVVSGCGTVSSPDGSRSISTFGGFISQNRQNIARLEYGMTKAQVHETMGMASIRDYANPYSSNLYRRDNGDVVEVLSYWTDGSYQDGISDDDLTPVVLVNNSVIGWGRTFFGDYVQKMEIKIR